MEVALELAVIQILPDRRNLVERLMGTRGAVPDNSSCRCRDVTLLGPEDFQYAPVSAGWHIRIPPAFRVRVEGSSNARTRGQSFELRSNLVSEPSYACLASDEVIASHVPPVRKPVYRSRNLDSLALRCRVNFVQVVVGGFFGGRLHSGTARAARVM